MLEFDEQLSRLQKPDREEMTDEEYAVFNKNVEVMEIILNQANLTRKSKS